jgi:WD40 repeat protein
LAEEQQRLADGQRVQAETQAQVARSRELASAAITRLDLDPELAVRLALHGVGTARTDQAESALRQALFRWMLTPRGPAARSQATSAEPALPMRQLVGHTDDVLAVAFSPDGTRLLSVSCDRTARLWNVSTGRELQVLRDHRASIAVGAWSRDGRSVLTAGGNPCLTRPERSDPRDSDVRVWEVDTGRVAARLTGSPSLLVGAAFSADGRQVAAGGVEGKALLWTLPSGDMRVLGDQSDGLETAGIQSVDFSPDGAQVATAGLDGSVVIWDARTGARLTTLRHKAGVLALSYAAAGSDVLLASVDLEGVVKVWDARTFVERREVRSYGAINSTAFSRDGRFLVTAGAELFIWETATGARMRALSGRGSLFAASISADGRRLAAGGARGFLGVLDCEVCVPLEGLMALTVEHVPSELTDQERRDFLMTDR